MDFMTPEKMHELGNILAHFDRKPVFGLPWFTTTILNTWIIWGMVVVLCFLATRRLSENKPGKLQSVLEMFVEFVYGLLEPAFGREGRKYLWFIGGLFVAVMTLNVSWLIPNMLPPVTDFSTTFGLGAFAILSVHVIGARKKGLKHYLHHYTSPSPIMAPLTLIEELMRPFTLAIRLFGNMFGEKMVVTVLFILAPLFLPTPVMILGALMGLVQAFVFTLLTTSYLTGILKGH
jgi:F-type H+-transporting ATPase subunit a